MEKEIVFKELKVLKFEYDSTSKKSNFIYFNLIRIFEIIEPKNYISKLSTIHEKKN